ncbi:MAG: phage portal protein [Alteromonadaceae bacterium]|nr:phage portal protein [Alteromonadaceae bacterium]
MFERWKRRRVVAASDGEDVARTEPPVMREAARASSSVSLDTGFEGRGFRVIGGRSAVSAEEAERYAAVYSCCNIIAGDMAKVPLRVVEKLGDNNFVPVDFHAVNYLLNVEPFDGVHAAGLRYALNYDYLLRGVSYAHVVRDGGGEVVSIAALQGASLRMLADGARIYDATDYLGRSVRLAGRSVLHMRYGARDMWTHRSPLSVAAATVALAADGHDAAARSASGDTLKGVAKVGYMESDAEEFERLDKRFRQSAKAAREKGQILVIGPDDDFKPLNMSAADMELLSTRKWDAKEIASMFRVPLWKLQDTQGGLKGAGQQAAIDYSGDCLSHWASGVEGASTMSLLTREERERGLRIKHDWTALLEPTTKEAYEAVNIAVGGPFMTVNEGRAMVGLNQIAGADPRPYPPPNMTREEKPHE